MTGHAGCRRGEALNLRWQNVGDNTLNLEDSKTGPRVLPWRATPTLPMRTPVEAAERVGNVIAGATGRSRQQQDTGTTCPTIPMRKPQTCKRVFTSGA